MKEKILEYIKEKYGNPITKVHQSHCMFPGEDCSCRNVEEITYDTSLIHGGYVDSLSMVHVLIMIETLFNIEIPVKESIPENFDTVNKMVELINRIKNG